MYNIIKETHSGIAYLVLLGLILSTIYYFMKFFSKKPLSTKSKTISLITMIAVHIQFLLGLILIFVSPKTQQVFKDFGGAMENDALRKQAVEHPITMLIVAILVTIANKRVKTSSVNALPLKATAPVLFLISLAAALAMIPWNIWFH